MSLLARLLLALLLVAQGAAAEVVRFPRPEFEGDRRFEYATQLLKLALSKMGPDYRVELADFPMNQERQMLASQTNESRCGAVQRPSSRNVVNLIAVAWV